MTRLSSAMQRALVGVRDHGDAAHGLRGRSEHGGLSRTLAALRTRGLLVRGQLTDAGHAAVANVPIGPSKDDSPEVQAEIGAAALAAARGPLGTDARAGHRAHQYDEDPPMLTGVAWWSGWLSREILTFELQLDEEQERARLSAVTREAVARDSEPDPNALAAVALAELDAVDDAEADALVEEFNQPVDDGGDLVVSPYHETPDGAL